ncbi:MAG TPA: hypothetical protein VLT45_13930 [Kofleriaceae bacterium]|nr:hypothetical protein [Kofleriaceae bacterium]
MRQARAPHAACAFGAGEDRARTCGQGRERTGAYNWRRHDEDESCEAAHRAALDPYSTAIHFRGWREGLFAAPAVRGAAAERGRG